MAVFHISAPATGVTKNGVISRVRTTPRPRNTRSSSSASSRPRMLEISTVTTMSNTELNATCQNCLVLHHVDVVLQPDELPRARAHQVPRQRRVVQREQERDLRDDDHEDQRRQQRPAPAPPFRPGHAGILRLLDPRDVFRLSASAAGRWRMVVMTSPDILRPTTSAYFWLWASASSTDFCRGDRGADLLAHPRAEVLELRELRGTAPRCKAPAATVGFSGLAPSIDSSVT